MSLPGHPGYPGHLGRLDARALGAIDLVDAVTGRRVSAPVRLRGDGVRTVRNRQGLHAIVAAPGLEAYAAAFDLDALDALDPPVELPAPLSLVCELEISDPSGAYLPRRASIRLPRQPERGVPDSVFTPMPLAMFRAPAAGTGAGWSILRAAVYGIPGILPGEEPDFGELVPANARPLPWASIVVTEVPEIPEPPDGGDGEPPRVMARAMSDHRGEALVGIPGVPRFTWAENEEDDTVIKPTMPVSVLLAWDPRADAAGWVPDPDTASEEIPDLKTRTLTMEVSAAKDTNAVFTIAI